MLYSNKVTSQFFCHHGTCSRAKEGIQHQSFWRTASQNQFGNKLFWFLSRMFRVLWHGPVGNGNIIPKVTRIGETKTTFLCFFPVFGLSFLTIGSQYPPLLLHRFHIKVKVLTTGGKPNILASIFPIGLGPPALFSLPHDAVSYNGVFFQQEIQAG